MRRLYVLTVLAAMAVSGVPGAEAQEPLDLKKMGTQMRRNQEELRQYSWESKTVFMVDGKQRRVDHYTVRYVMGKTLERMQISSEVSKEKLRWPDGSKLKKKDLEAAREFAFEVKKQVDAYLNPLFAEKIVATAAVERKDGILLLRSQNIVVPGDAVEVAMVESSRRPKTMSVTSSIDGAPASLEITFGSLDYGPNYTANSTTTSTWQGIELTIIAENSNYEKRKY